MKAFLKWPLTIQWLQRGLTGAAVMAVCVVSAQNALPDSNSKGAGATRLETTSPESFIKEAAKGNASEIAIAQLAQEKAQNAQVKDLARMVLTDHQKADEQLKPIAQAHGVSVGQSTEARQESALRKLQQTSGSEFDKEYVKDMLRDHQKDIAKFEKAARQLQAADVKQYAESCLPKLREHLEQSKRAAQALGMSQSEISSILHESPEAVGGTGESQESEMGGATNKNEKLNIEPAQ